MIREAIARVGLDPKDVGDVIMGCVLKAGAGMNVARPRGSGRGAASLCVGGGMGTAMIIEAS